MKACSENRKLIAWLAVGELDDQQAHKLRAHFETCNACRGYFDEMTGVTAKLSAAGFRSDFTASESFHRKVGARVRASESISVSRTLAVFLHAGAMRRMALPLIGATAAIILALVLLHRSSEVSLPIPRGQSVAAAPAKVDLPPTVANYQMVASQSLEKLDALLNSQAKRTPSPVPIYTASALALESASD